MKKSSIFYYARETKAISLLALAVLFVWAFISYKTAIESTIFSEKGMLVFLGLAVAGVASTVIRIYYRVMVIRYHENGADGISNL